MILFNRGCLWRPTTHAAGAVSRGSASFGWLATAVLAGLGGAAGAQSLVPLTLAEAERLALTGEPGQSAFLARSEAFRARSVSAGQLLDPTARIGLLNFPVESGGFTTEGMTQIQLGIRQALPRGQSRALKTELLQSQAEEMAANAGSRGRDVRAAVRQAWLETYYWHRAEAILGEVRPLFADLVSITQSLFSVGRARQPAVLQAELELSRLDDRLLQVDSQALAARAALQQWVGEHASRPLPSRIPIWPELPDPGTLLGGLAQHPAMQAADARILAQSHAVELAREQFKPGWMIDLGYGYRDGSLPSGEPRSDFVSLMVSVDLPLRRRHRQSRDLEAALQERRAAEQSRAELSRRLSSELQREYDRWQLLTQRIAGYEKRILVQADQRAQASLAAYQSDDGQLDEVLRGYIDQLETRLVHIRLQVERAQSFAVLANLGGLSL